jgi:transcriptional regulator
MYIPAPFKVHPALALAFAGARGFGLVVTCDGGRPVAASVPFLLIEAHGKSPRVQIHVARGNALALLAAKGGNWLLAVAGADAYVAPGWYKSPGQVPTWLYESVHLGGPVHIVPAADARDHLDALTARFEAGLVSNPRWTSARLTPERLDQLTQAIVVIEMLVETVEGAFKLNQHKADTDHAAVAKALAGQDASGARAIAARMVALRPHLIYEGSEGEPVAAAAGGGF